MLKITEYTIKIIYDPDVKFWVADCDELPGFILDSRLFDPLVTRVPAAVREHLNMNYYEFVEGVRLKYVTMDIRGYYLEHIGTPDPTRKY